MLNAPIYNYSMTLLYVNFLFVAFGVPGTLRLAFILRMVILHIWKLQNCHILIGCLFVNIE